MKIYHLQKKQLLNASIEKVWEFLSSPANLNEITPKDLKFEITSDLPNKIYTGEIITYKIEVIPFIKFTWVTEIKAVETNHYFIDEQRFGPYKFWYHQHKIEQQDDKTMMYDIIHYALPFGILGQIMHKLFIKSKLEKIFNYRFEYFDRKFNS